MLESTTMETECPHCHALFRVSEEQLELADGMVRCGFCKQVFDAGMENAFYDNEDQLDVFEDMYEAETPFEAPGLTVDEDNEADYFEVHDPFEKPEIDDDKEQQSVIPDDLRNDSQPYPPHLPGLAVWSLLILVLISTLAVEYLWFNRHSLERDKSILPMIADLCRHIDCERLDIQLRDTDRIELVNRNVYTHPNVSQALMISSTMVNQADFPQPYPEVQIDFSDVRGTLLASRRFSPDEYLQAEDEELPVMQPGTKISFGLEIRDPGKEAITYEFSFH